MTDSSVRAGTRTSWMIYGANSYTGELVCKEAVHRGHRPILAGRSGKKRVPIAERLGLDWVAANLRVLQKEVEKTVRGPDEEMRQTERSYVWARAADKEGNEAQVWLETLEACQFTAVGGVCCVETILENRPKGALTPVLALGADFVLQIEGTLRFDTLPRGK